MACLTGEQLAGWIDFHTREPFGFPIVDAQSAMTMSVIANSAGASPPTSHTDFSLATQFIEQPNEDGSPSDETLELKLTQLLKRAE